MKGVLSKPDHLPEYANASVDVRLEYTHLEGSDNLTQATLASSCSLCATA